MEQKHVSKELLEENANSAYPVLHETALFLYIHFLEHKKRHGTCPENALYANMGLLDFVQRLLEKRSATFYAKNDKYLLVNGTQGISGWEAVGSVIFFFYGLTDCKMFFTRYFWCKKCCSVCNDFLLSNET